MITMQPEAGNMNAIKSSEPENVIHLLGVTSLERKQSAREAHEDATWLDLHALIHSRLPFSAFERMARAVNLTVENAAKVLGIPTRTLWRRKQQNQLEQYESERVMRLARVFLRVVDVLGSEEKASTWLARENRGLGCSPLSLMDTDVGAKAVLDVLERIEYGVVG